MTSRFEHRNGLSCSEMEDELDDANVGITEQATLKLAALDRAEDAEAGANALIEARDNWHTAYIRERAESERLREALTRIAHGVHDDATYDVLDCALIARKALASAGGGSRR